MVRGLVTDSSASKQEASSRSDRRRTEIQGPPWAQGSRAAGGKRRAGVFSGLKGRDIETERDPDRARARGSSVALTLGALRRGTPPVLSPFSCLSLCLSSPGAQGPGSPSEPVVDRFQRPLWPYAWARLVLTVRGEKVKRAEVPGRERGSMAVRRVPAKVAAEAAGQRLNRAWDGWGCIRRRQRPGMRAATPPVRGTEGVLAGRPLSSPRPPLLALALPLNSPRRDQRGFLLPVFVRLLRRRHRPYYAHAPTCAAISPTNTAA